MHALARPSITSIALLLACMFSVGLSTISQQPAVAGAVAALALGVVMVTAVGLDGLGMAVLGVCFFMAPFFRAFPIVPGTAISAVDPLLVLAVALLLPRILRGKLDLSGLYLLSALAFFVIGCAAAVASDAASATLSELITWAFLAVILALAFATLGLSRREVAVLAVAYIAGQMLSSAVAFASGPDPVNQRFQGLAAHPNYFADGAMMAACLLLYLYRDIRLRTSLVQGTWWFAMAVCMAGIYVSGSRGGALGMAAVLLLIPLVERSGVAIFLGTLSVIAVVLILLPVAQNAGEGNTLARLSGSDGTGALTTEFRVGTWGDAIRQIAESPFLGHGLSLEVLKYHSNYLSIAAGLGVFAFVAYMLVLWSLARGLFGSSPERRLLYPMVAFAVYGLTQPGFQDRSNWLPMLLGIAVFHGYGVAVGWRDEPRQEPARDLVDA